MQLNFPGQERVTLICGCENRPTGPRARHARRLVQSLDCRGGELVDQSLSISCSMVGPVPRLSNGQTGQPVPEHIMLSGRPVPEHIMLGGRYSPRAYHIRLAEDRTYL